MILTAAGDDDNFSPKHLFNMSDSLTRTFHQLVTASFTDFDKITCKKKMNTP